MNISKNIYRIYYKINNENTINKLDEHLADFFNYTVNF